MIKHRSIADIARENNVSGDTIVHHMKKYGIEYWRSYNTSDLSDEDWKNIVDLYVNQGLSSNYLQHQFHVCRGAILAGLRKRGIETRGRAESQVNNREIDLGHFNDRDWMYQKYIVEGMHAYQIADLIGLHSSTIRNKLRSFGIPVRGRPQVNRKNKSSPARRKLLRKIRHYVQSFQYEAVIKRDQMKCCRCGFYPTQFNVHHIIPLNEIVSRVLQQHPDLDQHNENDTDALYELIIQDPLFLDLNNLISLCPECHKEIHNELRKLNTRQPAAKPLLEEGSETIEKTTKVGTE